MNSSSGCRVIFQVESFQLRNNFGYSHFVAFPSFCVEQHGTGKKVRIAVIFSQSWGLSFYRDSRSRDLSNWVTQIAAFNSSVRSRACRSMSSKLSKIFKIRLKKSRPRQILANPGPGLVKIPKSRLVPAPADLTWSRPRPNFVRSRPLVNSCSYQLKIKLKN